MTVAELVTVIESTYARGAAQCIIWDYTAAVFSHITSEELRQLMKTVDRYPRLGGKTALVGEDSLTYGLSRMVANLAEVNNATFAMGVFHTLEEALDWFAV